MYLWSITCCVAIATVTAFAGTCRSSLSLGRGYNNNKYNSVDLLHCLCSTTGRSIGSDGTCLYAARDAGAGSGGDVHHQEKKKMDNNNNSNNRSKNDKRKRGITHSNNKFSGDMQQYRIINSEIIQSKSVGDILNVFVKHGGLREQCFNAVNYSTAVHRLAKLSSRNKQSRVKLAEDVRFGYLVSRLALYLIER